MSLELPGKSAVAPARPEGFEPSTLGFEVRSSTLKGKSDGSDVFPNGNCSGIGAFCLAFAAEKFGLTGSGSEAQKRVDEVAA